MAREIVYTDDLDGTHGAEPVRFTWDSVEWEIDLAEANRKKLAEALAPYLEAAHPANVAQAKSTTTPTRRSSTDYSSPEFAGNPHRGRVTEAEATYVRENFDKVNKRLSAEGRPMLDPSDPKTKKRYGL